MRHNRNLILFVTLVGMAMQPADSAAQRHATSGRLSSFATRFNPRNVKRTHNIRVALKSLNKLVIKPGGVFSLNERLGKRTQARGYRTAVVFEDGRKVPGIGGGVSQVTGTLFNAALLAGLPIVEFHAHSRPVPYLPVGRDATLAYGAKDLRFKNNTTAPLRLSYQIRGNRLIARFYGLKRHGKQIRLSVNSRKIAKNHIVAKLYRRFKQDGKVVRTELVETSVYKWEPESPD
jgi:vancomycin resistance protein YoaR